MASDLGALGALFTQAWPEVGHKTAVEEAEVKRAAALGPQLLVALGARKVDAQSGPPGPTDRARARTTSAGGR